MNEHDSRILATESIARNALRDHDGPIIWVWADTVIVEDDGEDVEQYEAGQLETAKAEFPTAAIVDRSSTNLYRKVR